MTQVFDHRSCQLGEGVLWHPIREQLFWFDILGSKLYSRDGDTPLEWAFAEMVSAAGWVSRAELLIASETGLFVFNVDTGARKDICAIEADNPNTRSNDGRADPQGGFWIGTIGKSVGPKEGAIYRYYRGELRKLYDGVSIPNAICFAPSAALAYFTDTETQKIMQVGLDAEGWPNAIPKVFLDLTAEGLNPDGAVVDTEGNLWNAQWGAARVACYNAAGTFLRAVDVASPHAACPCFGGADMSVLYCTTATVGMSAEHLLATPDAGKVFAAQTNSKGQYEHQVILS